MFLKFLILVHVLFGAGAIATGTVFAFPLLFGRLDSRHAIRFLKWSLVASAAGLLLAVHHPGSIGWAAALGVYLSAVAVFAWRVYRSTNHWFQGFLFSTLGVLCLDTAVLCAHIAKLLIRLNVLSSAESGSSFIASLVIGGSLFALLSIYVAIRSHPKGDGTVV